MPSDCVSMWLYKMTLFKVTLFNFNPLYKVCQVSHKIDMHRNF